MLKQFAIATATASLLIAGPSSAEVVFVVADQVFNGDGSTPGQTRGLNTTQGAVSAPTTTLPTLEFMTYTITGLDLTSVGGTANETIVYNVAYTQTGGTGIQFSAFGNIAVTGGSNAQVDNDETLRADVSLSSTTFAGDIDLGIIQFSVGGNQPTDAWNVIHEGGTVVLPAGSSNGTSFAPSSFVTLDPQSGNGVNFQRLEVQVTATPEPGSLALLGLGGLLVARRRRA